MTKFKRIFLFLVLLTLFISTSVLAVETDKVNDLLMTTTEAPATTQTTGPVETLNEDLYIYKSESYTLDNIINGNVFASTTRFSVNPRNGGGILSGNLYLISNDVTIGSDVTYSNTKNTNGDYLISSINSKSIINGNVYILTDSFTLEAGSEIHGDVYIVSKKADIQQDTVIDGNLFIVTDDLTLTGQITGSVYTTTSNFNFDYLATISRDLYLTSESSTLSGVIHRNAFITSSSLNTVKGFRVTGNLTVNYAKDFSYSGEVYGDAKINVETLSFKQDAETKNSIGGDLKYATKNECQIPDGVVKGKVSSEKFVNKDFRKFNFGGILLSLVALLVYVLGIVFLAQKFAPNATQKLPEFNTRNCLISLGIGLISFLAVALLFVLLIVTGIGIYLAFALCMAYIFAIAISVPLFIYKLADFFKLKWNTYLKLLVVTVIFYVIKFIPVIGPLVVFVVFTAGIGQIILGLLKKD